MAKAKKKINVAIVYNPFNLEKIEMHELVYNKKFKLGDYMEGLPDNVNWTIGYNGKAYQKKEEWENLVIKPDDKISLVVTPLGGGGGEGEDDKGILRMIATIAIAVFAFYVIGPLFSGALMSALAVATFTIAGVLLVNAVLPPPGLTPPKKISNTYGEDGPKNTSREGIVVPIVYGKYRVAGNIVDLYNKNVGDDQYLFMRTIINDGRVQSIGDIYINDQPIANFTDVETRIELGNGSVGQNDWFGETVRPINRNQKLTTSNFTHTTTTNVDRVRLDLVFPRGLCKFGKNNSVNSHTVNLYAEYRAFGTSGAWLPLVQSQDVVFLRYNTSVGFLPGYGASPPRNGISSWSYGDPSRYNGTSWVLNDDIDYYGDVDLFQGVNPATTDLQGAVGSVTPVGSSRVTMQVRAIVASLTSDSTSGTYDIRPAYRKVGDTTWTYIGSESGTVDKTSGNDDWSVFPTINRTVQFSVDPAFQYEVTAFGGSIISATATVNTTSSGLISITRAKDSTVRFSYESGVLTRGRYDIRIRRSTAEATDKTFADEVYLSDVNEIDLDNIAYAGTANLSLKIKMTDQLSNVPNVTAMVEGSLVKKYDESGNVIATNHYTRYPPYQVLDVLLNQDRGRGFSPSRIDYAAFAEWEKDCIQKGLQSNLVFDTDSNVWDATMLLCRLGHGSIVKLGNKFSVVSDKATDPVMLFNDSNMFRDTFQTSWIPVIDRANEIHYTYYPEASDFKQEMLRVVDPDAINSGEALRVAQVTQIGVTNLAQATYDIEKQLRENKLIRKGVSFEAPLEAIGLMLGDVALVQHNSANYGRGVGTGRLKPGSTVSALALDAPVTLETGKTYKALVILPSVKRYDVTVQSISGDTVFVTGLPSGVIARCRRLVQGAKDVSVVNIYDASPHDKVICSDATGLTTGAAELWDTDVIEERTVTNGVGEYTTVNLNTALSVVPPEYGIYMIGPVEEVTRPYRLRAITGDSIHRKKLDFVEYNAQVYAPLGASVTLPTPKPSRVSAHVINLATKQSLTIAGDISTTKVTLTWDRGDSYYAGADIYSRQDGRDWVFDRAVQNVMSAEFSANVGESTEYAVVAYNNFGNRAPLKTAPSTIVYVNPNYETLVTPSGLTVTQNYFKVDATSVLAWTYPDYEKIAHYFEAQILPVTLTQFNQFNASTWTPTDTASWVPATGIDNKTAKFSEQAVGYYIYRVRAVFGSAASTWAMVSQNLIAPALPTTPTNISINNGTPSVSSASFASRDVTVTWLGVVEQSIPLSNIDENSVGYYWRDYVVTVSTVGGTVLRTTYTTDPFFNYTYDMNRADCIAAGITSVEANRQFIIKIGFRGYQGQISSEFSVTCTNATPAVPTISTRVTPTTATIVFPNPIDSDYRGVKVWLSTTNGFTPNSGNLVWDDSGTPVLNVTPSTTYYARLALYDSFDKTNGLAVSSQFTFTTGTLEAGAGIGGAPILNSQVTGFANQIIDTEFTYPTRTWTNNYSSSGTWTFSSNTTGGVRYYRRSASNAAAGAQVNLGSDAQMAFPVVAGQRVEASVLLSWLNFSGATLFVTWYDANRAYLTDSSVAFTTTNGSTIGGFVSAPANARFAGLTVAGNTATASISSYLEIGRPFLRIASAEQTALSPYVPGPVERNADQTSSNTAAAFLGQGTRATTNVYRQSTAPASPVQWDEWQDISVFPALIKLRIDGFWITVAEEGSTVGSIVGGNFKFPDGSIAPIGRVDNLYNAIGVNQVINSDFNQGTTGFFFLNATNLTGTGLGTNSGRNLSGWFGVRNVLWAVASVTSGSLSPAGGGYLYGWGDNGFYGGLSNLNRYATRVKAGDRVFVAHLVAAHRSSLVGFEVRWFNKDGTLISSNNKQIASNGAGFNNGDPANAQLVQEFFTAPAGAAFASTAPYVANVFAGVDSTYIFHADPHICVVPANQITPPVYNAGPVDRAADRTGENTAGGFLGQGNQATTNIYRQATAPTSPQENDQWYDTSTTPVSIRRRISGAWVFQGEEGADITAQAVPSLEGPASVSFDVDGAGALSPGSQVPRTLQFVRKRGNTDVSTSTTWSIVSAVNVTLGTITNGGVNITAVAAGLSNFTVRSVRDGVTLDLVVNVTKNTIAAGVSPPDIIKGNIIENGTLGYASSTAWTTVMSVNLPNCPGGYFQTNGVYSPLTATGNVTVEARITVNGAQVGSIFTGKVFALGGTPQVDDISDVLGQFLSIAAGNRTVALQFRAPSTTGTINTGNGQFIVNVIPTS